MIAFIEGIRRKYPICCVIAFSLHLKCKGVVLRNNDPSDVFKPCILHKRFAISDKEHLILLNNGRSPFSEDGKWTAICDRNFDQDGNYKAVTANW